MPDREKVIKGLETIKQFFEYGLPSTAEIFDSYYGTLNDAIALLKEQENEYENGFNDAMLGKQELMYEDIDGKWHKKDW